MSEKKEILMQEETSISSYRRGYRKWRRDQRRKEAQERLDSWRALSPKAQLAELDRRGVRATKQRARIHSQMEEK